MCGAQPSDFPGNPSNTARPKVTHNHGARLCIGACVCVPVRLGACASRWSKEVMKLDVEVLMLGTLKKLLLLVMQQIWDYREHGIIAKIVKTSRILKGRSLSR